jgi:hypothetical protein
MKNAPCQVDGHGAFFIVEHEDKGIVCFLFLEINRKNEFSIFKIHILRYDNKR